MQLLLREEKSSFYTGDSKNLSGDAGFDLYIKNTEVIGPGETCMIDLDVSCQMREFTWNFFVWFRTKSFYKYYGYMLVPRSSISKTPLLLKNSIGIIDSTYTGNLKACVLNTSNKPFIINKGERYFQIIHPTMKPFSAQIVKSLRNTKRGKGGFGSTGK